MRRTCMLLGLAGCQPTSMYGLDVVPIHGATLDQEDVLRVEIRQILRTMDARSVVLSAVELVDELPDGIGVGQYDARDASIMLTFRADGLMRTTLRHEVCHAMDHQYGGLADGYASGVLTAYRMLVDNDETYRTNRQRRSEGFAQLCELGPGPLRGLAEDDRADETMREAATWLLDEIALVEPTGPETFRWAQFPSSPRPDVAVDWNGVLTLTWPNHVAAIDWDGNPVEPGNSSGSLHNVNHNDIIREGEGLRLRALMPPSMQLPSASACSRPAA